MAQPPAATPAVTRPLAATEAAFATVATTITYYSLATGEVDIPLLHRAFDALAQRNPVLYGSITAQNSGFVLHRGCERPLPLWVGHGDPTEFFAGWALPVDQTRDLARLDVAVRDGSVAVGLTLHHAIADGRAGFALLTELWSLYRDLAAGRGIDPLVRPIPRPIESALPTAAAPPTDNLTDIPGAPVTGQASAQAQFTIQLSTEQTAALAGFAREHRVTVHALVTGATLTAERRLTGGAGPELLLTSSAVDLRGALPEPMAPLDGTNIIAVVPDGIVVDGDTWWVDAGRAVIDRIRAERRSGTILARSLLTSVDLAVLLAAPPMSFVTNIGAVPDIPTPPGLQITDLRFAFPNQVSRSITYVVTCWRGRLRIDVLYPMLGLPPDRAAQLRTDLTSLLTLNVRFR